MPLAQSADGHSALKRGPPVAAVCRSGTRSAPACQRLSAAGFAQVANLAGGMLRWRDQGYPAEGTSGARAKKGAEGAKDAEDANATL